MTKEPILKRNLVKGQVVYYFTPPVISSDGLDYHNKKPAIQKLEFDSFYRGRYNGDCTLFYNEKGTKKKFYEAIKGLLFHTKDEAQEALNVQTKAVKTEMIKKTKKHIIKMQKQLVQLEEELGV